MFGRNIILVILLLVVIPPVFAENDSIVKITNTLTDSVSPSIAVSGSDIYMVWTESSRNGNSEMFFSKSRDGGESFSQPKNILSQKGSPLAPIIATNGENVFLTWMYRYPDNYSEGWSDDNSQVFFSMSNDGGDTFSDPLMISDKTTFSSGSMMAIDGKNIFITWSTQSTPWKPSSKSPDRAFLSKSNDGGNTFSEPLNLSNDQGPSATPIITTEGSNIFLVWQGDHMDDTGIFFSRSSDGGETFSEPLNISKERPHSVGAYITSYDSKIFVTWASFKEGKDPEIFFSKSTDGGNTFSEPKNISNTSGYSILSPIVTDGKNIFVAWGESKSNTRSILLTNSTDGGETFSKPISISNQGVSDSPSIAYDGKNLFASWSRQKELFKDPLEIYFSKISIKSQLEENEEMIDQTVDKISDIDQEDQSTSSQTYVDEDIKGPTNKSIKWIDENGANYSVGGLGVIRLDNKDLNANTTLIDIPIVHAWSDTDQEGILVDIIETGANTGIFYADINLSGTESSHLQLHVSNGDSITVSFEDSQTKPLVDSLSLTSMHNSPYQQLEQGVPLGEISCGDKHKLFIKNNLKPLCLKQKTFDILTQRGYF